MFLHGVQFSQNVARDALPCWAWKLGLWIIGARMRRIRAFTLSYDGNNLFYLLRVLSLAFVYAQPQLVCRLIACLVGKKINIGIHLQPSIYKS